MIGLLNDYLVPKFYLDKFTVNSPNQGVNTIPDWLNVLDIH